MTFDQLSRSLRSWLRGTSNPAPRRTRLRLEVLEGKALPSGGLSSAGGTGDTSGHHSGDGGTTSGGSTSGSGSASVDDGTAQHDDGFGHNVTDDKGAGTGGGKRHLTSSFVVGDDAGGSPEITVFNEDGSERFHVSPFPTLFTGGMRVATGDVNGDGVEDIVAVVGPGTSPTLKVIDGKTGQITRTELVFEDSFTGGLNVTTGDVNNDGKDDIIITADRGGGPRVRILSGADDSVLADFLAIDDPKFRGGARAAVADVNGDGTPDLIVAAGFGGGPRVAIYDGKTLLSGDPQKLVGDFFIFENTLRNGAFITAGDIDGDGNADIIAGGGPGGGPRVFAISGKDLVASGGSQMTTLANFFAGDVNSRGGIRVAAKDLDGDDKADLVTGSGEGDGSQVETFDGKDLKPDDTPHASTDVEAFSGSTRGVFVG